MTRIPRIFIVEDNFMYSYTLEAILKEQDNFSITSFASAEECIELLDNNPDVIILDYNLDQKMNGFDTFKLILSIKPKIPIIILSGQTDLQVAADLLKAGAFDYIQKKKMEETIDKLRYSILNAFKRKK